MAKTLKEITYSVLEAISNFELNDDFPITESWVEDQIITMNHTLLRKAHSERRIDEMLYMFDEMLRVKPLDKSLTIEGLPVKNITDYCYIDLKPLVTGLKGLEIDVVTNASYSLYFTKKTLKQIVRGSSGYFTTTKPTYAIVNGIMLFEKNKMTGTKYVSINGIWSDPRTVSTWNPEMAFPTPSEKNLELLTVQHIQAASQNPMDVINDGQRAYAPAKSEK